MKRLLLSLFAAAALLLAGAPGIAQVTTDATKTGVPVAAAVGSGTFAQMKTVTCSSSVNDGALYNVTNYGRGGSTWRCSGSIGDWFPTAPVKIYEKATTTTGVAQTAEQVLLAIPIEANLLKNKTFRLIYTFGKNGTTDTITPNVRMGSAGTIADAALVSPSAPVAGARRVGYEALVNMATATSAVMMGGGLNAPFIGGTTSIALNTSVTVGDVGNANFINLTCTMSGTTDTPMLGYIAVEILP